MKQLQFYKYATWGLLLLNISMVAFFFLTAPPHGPQHRGKKNDVLKLDKQQDESFEKLRQQHIQLMNGFNNQQRDLLKPYFNSITDQNKTIDIDSLLRQVQVVERKKIESTYQHFQDVKSILKPEQQPDFREFTEHAVKRILLEDKKNPPPPKKNN